MSDFVHQRHKPPETLHEPRELLVACAPMHSNINLSRIVRTAGCCGIRQIICCGHPKVIGKIARDGAEQVQLRVHRTLLHPLLELKREGYKLVGLEQTSGSQRLFDYRFERRTILVVGNERLGLDEDILRILDAVVEIPVYGLPFSYNVATAAAMALYEFCRQFPQG